MVCLFGWWGDGLHALAKGWWGGGSEPMETPKEERADDG